MKTFICEVCENEYPEKCRRECKHYSRDICEFCSIGIECCECCYEIYKGGSKNEM